MLRKKSCFTLAEVLIVIGVIGVVAAITIPTLINSISPKAKEAQTKTIEARLLDGINRYSAMEDGLSQKHETTYDFLVGLSKYYKMSQICSAEDIAKCIPYSKIYSGDGSKVADVKSLKTINKFIPGEAAKNYLEPASFISSQGTPFVMALKKDCIWDMGQAMRSVEDSGCIAYLYDKNGAGLPNRLGDDSDIVGHGLTVNDFPFAVVNGIKIMEKAFKPSQGLTKSECEAEIPKEAEYKKLGFTDGITQCYFGSDAWAYGMKYCKEKGWHLPTADESLLLVQGLFKNANGEHPTGSNGYANYTFDTELANDINIAIPTASWFDSTFWISVQSGGANAYIRRLGTGGTDTRSFDVYRNGLRLIICVGN